MFSTEQRASNQPWSEFPPSAYTPAQWKSACLIDKGTGDEDSKDRYALPVREPSGVLNINGVHAAAGRVSMVGVSPEKKAAAARQLVRLYSEIEEECPDDLAKLAGAGDDEGGDIEHRGKRWPVEERAATVNNVDFKDRVMTVVAVPYEQETVVPYRGEAWREIFTRSAFQGFNPHNPRQRVVPVGAVLRAPAYDHNDGILVGHVSNVYPDRTEGLVIDIHVSNTEAGTDTLHLAHDGALYPSVGFAVRGSDQHLDTRSKRRRVNKAFLDHVSMVPTPAYQGAKVLSVRAEAPADAATLPPLRTPALDEILSDPVFSWAFERRNGRM